MTKMTKLAVAIGTRRNLFLVSPKKKQADASFLTFVDRFVKLLASRQRPHAPYRIRYVDWVKVDAFSYKFAEHGDKLLFKTLLGSLHEVSPLWTSRAWIARRRRQTAKRMLYG
jgi:hypothetical protein